MATSRGGASNPSSRNSVSGSPSSPEHVKHLDTFDSSSLISSPLGSRIPRSDPRQEDPASADEAPSPRDWVKPLKLAFEALITHLDSVRPVRRKATETRRALDQKLNTWAYRVISDIPGAEAGVGNAHREHREALVPLAEAEEKFEELSARFLRTSTYFLPVLTGDSGQESGAARHVVQHHRRHPDVLTKLEELLPSEEIFVTCDEKSRELDLLREGLQDMHQIRRAMENAGEPPPENFKFDIEALEERIRETNDIVIRLRANTSILEPTNHREESDSGSPSEVDD